MTSVDSLEVQMLSPGRLGLVKPEQTHFITPMGTLRMRIDFHDSAPDMAALTTADDKEG